MKKTIPSWEGGITINGNQCKGWFPFALVKMLDSLTNMESGLQERLQNWEEGMTVNGTNIKNLRYADDTTHIAASKKELETL